MNPAINPLRPSPLVPSRHKPIARAASTVGPRVLLGASAFGPLAALGVLAAVSALLTLTGCGSSSSGAAAVQATPSGLVVSSPTQSGLVESIAVQLGTNPADTNTRLREVLEKIFTGQKTVAELSPEDQKLVLMALKYEQGRKRAAREGTVRPR
jgi:hypothetical protein